MKIKKIWELYKELLSLRRKVVKLEAYNEKLLNSDIEKHNKIVELEAQIEKMKCCENCKYNSYWGNELHCNYGLKEALNEDRLVECKEMDKWEIKEND